MKLLIYTIFLFAFFTSCRPQSNTHPPPETMDDGWAVAAPGEQGADQQQLFHIIDNIPSTNPELDGLVIALHGKLIAEQYFNGYE